MKKPLKFYVLTIFVFIISFSQAQHSQTIRGRVIDTDSKQSLPGANIILLNTNPLIGTSSDMDGNFEIKNVKVGRYSIQVSFLGYQTATLRASSSRLWKRAALRRKRLASSAGMPLE